MPVLVAAVPVVPALFLVGRDVAVAQEEQEAVDCRVVVLAAFPFFLVLVVPVVVVVLVSQELRHLSALFVRQLSQNGSRGDLIVLHMAFC